MTDDEIKFQILKNIPSEKPTVKEQYKATEAIFKILKDQLTIHSFVVSDFCECTYIRHKDTWIREDGKVICFHCHKQKH